MTTHYFLGTRLLASSPARPWWDATRLDSFSSLFVCPNCDCGQVWGRIIIDGAEWLPLRRHCQAHGSGHFIPPWTVPLDPYPLPVLQREFLLEIEHHYPHFGDLHAQPQDQA